MKMLHFLKKTTLLLCVLAVTGIRTEDDFQSGKFSLPTHHIMFLP